MSLHAWSAVRITRVVAVVHVAEVIELHIGTHARRLIERLGSIRFRIPVAGVDGENFLPGLEIDLIVASQSACGGGLQLKWLQSKVG